MKIVYGYYLSLDKIYEILVDKREIEKLTRFIRALIIDQYYMQIERSIKIYLERARLVSLNPDRISEQELVHDIKEFFIRTFYSNLHFFISILFLEIKEIIKVVEGVANMAIKYQIYYDEYKEMANDLKKVALQPPEQKNKLLYSLTSSIEANLNVFDNRIKAVDENTFAPKKKGFFQGIFGADSPEKQTPQRPGLTEEAQARYIPEEQKWHFFSEDENAFFLDLQEKRKDWIQKAEEIKSKEVMKKELLDFRLNNNLLNGPLYESTFRNMNLSVKESIDSCRRVQFFYSLMEEVMRNMLLLEKRRVFVKLQIKEHVKSPPEILLSKLNELEVVRDAYNLLLEKIERSSEAGVDQIYATLRRFIEKYRSVATKEVESHRALKSDCESEIIKNSSIRVDPNQVMAQIDQGFIKFEQELRSEKQVVKLNFFSLYDPDLEKMEINFNKCFEMYDRVYLNAIKHERTYQNNPSLMAMISQFEEVDYFMKKLVSSMKKVSISRIGIFSNIKFGSNNFLTDDQGTRNESEILLCNLKENSEELKLVNEVLGKRLSQTPAESKSRQILSYYRELFIFIEDMTEYLLKVYEALYQQWMTANRDFKRLIKEKDANFWFKNLSKFKQVQIEEVLIIQNKSSSDLSDLKSFIDEVYALFVQSVRFGVKVLDLKEICQQIVVTILSDYDTKKKQPALVLDGLKRAQDLLSKCEGSAADLDQELKNNSLSEGYLFVVGDGVKKYSLDDPTASPLGLLFALKSWLQAIIEVVKAWKDFSKSKEIMEKDVKSIDHSKINKWLSAKRCQDQILSYLKFL